jgi:hypothetical protein
MLSCTVSSLGRPTPPSSSASTTNESWEEPLYSPKELGGIFPVDSKQPVDVRLVLARILDGSRFHEFKKNYGATLVTGFGKIMGQDVGIIANNGLSEKPLGVTCPTLLSTGYSFCFYRTHLSVGQIRTRVLPSTELRRLFHRDSPEAHAHSGGARSGKLRQCGQLILACSCGRADPVGKVKCWPRYNATYSGANDLRRRGGLQTTY